MAIGPHYDLSEMEGFMPKFDRHVELNLSTPSQSMPEMQKLRRASFGNRRSLQVLEHRL